MQLISTSPPFPLHRRGALCDTEMNRAKATSPVERAGGEVKNVTSIQPELMSALES